MTDRGTPDQLAFDLPRQPSLGREDFIAAPSNAAALALIDRWPDWPGGLAAIIGPEGSGKSHLGAIWRAASGALAVDGRRVAAVPEGVRAALVEPLGAPADEVGLFHLINAMKHAGGHVLFICRTAPEDAVRSLPDLRSRLQAATIARIEPPEDALVVALIARHFAARQLAVDADVAGFVAARIERSHAAVAAIVEAIDREAMARRARITRPLAAAVLKRAGVDDQPDLF